MFNKAKLDELRRLAEAATPGPWVVDKKNPGIVRMPAVDSSAGMFVGRSAAYVAAMHPQQTLALLNEIEQLTESGTKTARAKNGEENSEPAEGFEPPTL